MDQVTNSPHVQNPPQQNQAPIVQHSVQNPQMQHRANETSKSMRKIFCFLILGLLFVAVVIAGIYGASKLIRSKGKWICVDGEWVKEGNPSDPNPPTTPCSGTNGSDGTSENNKLNLNAPLPTSPSDKKEIFELGDLTISTYNPVTFTALETSTNLYFEVENTSDAKATISYVQEAPNDNEEPIFQHLFWLFDKDKVSIAAKQKKILEFVAAPSGNQDQSEGKVPFTFKNNSNEEITIDLSIQFDDTNNFNALPKTAIISGKVYDAIGTPLDQAETTLFLYNSYEQIVEQTDQDGAYTFIIPSIDDIRSAIGDRPRQYDSLGYYVSVKKNGYEFGYSGDITPIRSETKSIDFNLDPFVNEYDYTEVGQLKENGVYGYFWLMPVKNFDLLAAVQGRHPPELNKPGQIIAFDNSGSKQWEIKTKNECWGFDVSKNGLIAAACHDGTLYVVNSIGTILWQKNVGAQAREVEFSNKGDKLIVGPYHTQSGNFDFALLQADNGSIIWSKGKYDEWLRNSRFSPDDQRIVIGLSGGRLLEYSIQGELIWQKFIGEFPMVLEVDSSYNVYAAGKNRELFSYDLLGMLRFRKAIPNHVVTAGSDNMDENGKMIVMGTVGAQIYAFDPNGEVLWQRKMNGELQGHNALDVTPDGNYIAVGSAGLENGGWLQVYDKSGNLLWEKQYKDSRDPSKLDYTFDHNQSGVITIAISDDGQYVAAGFGDSSIRIFKQKSE